MMFPQQSRPSGLLYCYYGRPLWSPFSSIKTTHESNEPFFLFGVDHASWSAFYRRVQMNESKVWSFSSEINITAEENKTIPEKETHTRVIFVLHKRAHLFFGRSVVPLNVIFDHAVDDLFRLIAGHDCSHMPWSFNYRMYRFY
jgi:hypothetical protein